MSEGRPASRLFIQWSVEAQAELSAIDRSAALDIRHCLDRYLASRNGDVNKLKSPMTGFRLRCEDYRAFFRQLVRKA